MNLRQMEYLLAIVETKNISRAAERCYISQSGMSQQLASVEKELGASMFQRINNELVPTREGEIYIRYAREILGLHARAKRNGRLRESKQRPDSHRCFARTRQCHDAADISDFPAELSGGTVSYYGKSSV